MFRKVPFAPADPEQSGVLRLTFSSGGKVSGTYNPRFGTYFVHVAGVRRGDKLWSSIGASKFAGTVRADGTISGTVWTYRGRDRFAFTAIPTSAPRQKAPFR